MRPMTFINGVILGSSGALGCVLGLIVFFRWVLTQDSTLDQTVVLSSLPLGELLQDMVIFLSLAVLAGAGFAGELLRKPWRGGVDYLLMTAVVGVILFFFADAAARVRDLVLLGLIALVGAGALTALARFGLLQRIFTWLEG